MKFATPFDWKFPWGDAKAVRGHDAFIAKVKDYNISIKDPEEPLTVWGYLEPFHGSMSRQDTDLISTTRPIMIWQFFTKKKFFHHGCT